MLRPAAANAQAQSLSTDHLYFYDAGGKVTARDVELARRIEKIHSE